MQAGSARQLKEAIQGEAVKSAVHDFGDAGLVDAESVGGFRLGQSTVPNDLGNASCELRFRQQFVRVLNPEISKDVVANACEANRSSAHRALRSV